MTPRRIKMTLVKAKRLIADPKRWGKGATKVALDYHHREKGYRYCAWGAIEEVLREEGVHEQEFSDLIQGCLRALNEVVLQRHDTRTSLTENSILPPVVQYNDDSNIGHAEVISAFDEAVQRKAKEVLES